MSINTMSGDGLTVESVLVADAKNTAIEWDFLVFLDGGE